jgi:hypothetical protein
MIDSMSAAYPTTRPWSAFVTVKDRLRLRDQVLARQDLHRIIDSPDAGTTEKLIAWNILREMGENPDVSGARQLRGVVVEIPTPQEPQVLTVYDDGTIAQLDQFGNLGDSAGDGSTAPLLGQQIEDAQKLAEKFTPIGDLPAPARSAPRVTVLTFGGMRSKEVEAGGAESESLTPLVNRARAIQAATSATRRSDRN